MNRAETTQRNCQDPGYLVDYISKVIEDVGSQRETALLCSHELSAKEKNILWLLVENGNFSHSSVGKESACNAGDFSSISGSGIEYRNIPVFLGFPGGSAAKESACNVGDLGSTPGLGRSPGEGKGYSLRYSGLENSMDYVIQRVGHN